MYLPKMMHFGLERLPQGKRTLTFYKTPCGDYTCEATEERKAVTCRRCRAWLKEREERT